MSKTSNSDPSTQESAQIHKDGNFLVVGLGASAGGVQALRDFFSNVPARTGMAYVVILHLSPDHDSQLSEILQSSSALPVTKVEQTVRVEPDHVYVIPPNKTLEINDGQIEVSNITSNEVRRAPGDIFFRTLAQSHMDITDRDRAEKLIRESEEQFRRTIEDAPIPIIMYAEDGEVLQVSRTWTTLTGYTITDLPTFDAFLTQTYGEAADGVRGQMHDLFNEQRRSLDIEFPIRTRDGDVRYWSFSASLPGTLRDGRRFIVGMALDITERRIAAQRVFQESDARLRLMMESVEDYAILMLGLDGAIEMWNSGAERAFGYTAEEVIGQNVAIIFTPEDRRSEIPLKERETARKDGRASDERWHQRKDGTRFYVSGSLSSLHDTDGAVKGYVKIARDLSEQRRVEEELRRANDELEVRVRERTFELAKVNESLRDEISERIQTEKDRVRLLRQIVRAQEDERRRIARDIHDHIGQQMTALRLSLAGLDQGYGDTEAREKLEQTKTIAQRLDADVDFLAWELRPATLDDIGLAEAMSTFVGQWSKHSGVEAQFHTTGFDKGRLSPETETNLYRILQEALNNTLKYAHAKRVDVLLERRDNQVVLIVEDDGVGFNPNKGASADGNRGMGLIGMRERAAIVGGTLQIESQPEAGTTIFARVPTEFIAEEAKEAK